jgi:hypothetical protein
MQFRELPRAQQILFVAHSLAAVAGFLASYATILNMAERAALPSETGIKSHSQSDAGKSRGYFDQ